MTAQFGTQILYVDDEVQSLKLFKQLYGDRFEIVTAESAALGLEYIEQHADQVAVLVTDQRMPGKTGVELMEVTRSRYPNIVRVLVTAFTQLDAAVKAVNEGGAFRYLTKPWSDDEMIGTLLRASEYHQAMQQRDLLLREKLSVLHRLVVMDRVRGLATVAAALEGRLRGTWLALVDYLSEAPVKKRIRSQLDAILGMNMSAIARRESEAMVKTVRVVLGDTAGASTGDESFDVHGLVRNFCNQISSELNRDDILLSTEIPDAPFQIVSDAGLLRRLVHTMLRRLADFQEQPAEISLQVTSTPDEITIDAQGRFGKLSHDQEAALFSAAIPLRNWPLGLDMDSLAAFMICRHLGGRLAIAAQADAGPLFRAVLPTSAATVSQPPFDPAWLDTIYDSLSIWEEVDETY